MVNKVQLIGRLGKDPEVKNLEGGTSLATFTLATTETWKDKAGEKKEETTWHNIVIFGGLTKIVESYTKKGDLLYVEGKIRNRSYKDKDDNTKYISEVLVSDLKLFPRSSGNGEAKAETKHDDAPPPPPPSATGLPF